jgi:hypothetical protein
MHRLRVRLLRPADLVAVRDRPSPGRVRVSRRRRPQVAGYRIVGDWLLPVLLRPVEAARRERVRRQIRRVKRRAARRWTT